MFFSCDSPSIRYTGRYAKLADAMVATATGSTFEIAFVGDMITLHFDLSGNEHPMPHLWLCLDGGAKFEVPLDRYLRVECESGAHTLTVIHKGAKEIQSRFFHPLVGKISFVGYEAEAEGTLSPDTRKTIEFVGDSITEGVLIDEFYRVDGWDDQDNRPYQDDVTATYAYLTAKALGLRDLHMGYGAVGVTRAGCGDVPKAREAYPYCFEGAPVTYAHPDYILINHGANDRPKGAEVYTEEYFELLKTVRAAHPDSKIFALSAFVGFAPRELEQTVARFNRDFNDSVVFISSEGWIPADPLHPWRDGHCTVAAHLIEALRPYVNG